MGNNVEHDEFEVQKAATLPLVIISIGILFSLYLQHQTPDGIFFSGDGGLKFLLTKQLSLGKFQFDLDLPAADWVKQIWQEGFYPFKPPFAYEISNRRYITFPFTFPLVSALFYKLFGFKGLYVLPLVSTWATWFTLYWLCQRLEIGKIATSVSLMTLIFASPLTVYSGIFWEHTLAVAIAFGGVAILFSSNYNNISNIAIVLSGILIGLSVWFREEMLCLVVGICLLATIVFSLSIKGSIALSKNKIILFIITLLLTVALFFGLNILIYANPLGTHAFQVVESVSLITRLKNFIENFKVLNWNFIHYFPIVIFLSIYLLMSLFRKISLTNEVKFLLLFSLVFLLILPAILPTTEGISLASRTGGKQWGPRFLLILVPFSCTMIASITQSIVSTRNLILKYAAIAVFSTLSIVGIYTNSYASIADLANTQTTVSLINQLQSKPNQVIVTSHQYVNQALTTLFDQKLFFLAETSQELEKLGTELYHQGYPKFLYICYPYRKCQVAEEKSEVLTPLSNRARHMIKVSSMGIFGKYPLYEVSVSKINESSRQELSRF
jgi:hypothetical protein